MKLRVRLSYLVCMLISLSIIAPAPANAQFKNKLRKMGRAMGIEVKNDDFQNKPTPPKEITSKDEPTVIPPHALADNFKSSTTLPSTMGLYISSDGKYLVMKDEAFGTTQLKQSIAGSLIGYLAIGNKGFLDGLHAETILSPEAEFLLVIPTSASITGARLIYFDLNTKENRREFKATKTDGWGNLGMSKNNTREFGFREISAHTYKIMMKNPVPGEYSFLAYNSLGAASLYPFAIK